MILDYHLPSRHKSPAKLHRGLGSATNALIFRMGVFGHDRGGKRISVESLQDDGLGCVCNFDIRGCGEGAEGFEGDGFCSCFSYLF